MDYPAVKDRKKTGELASEREGAPDVDRYGRGRRPVAKQLASEREGAPTYLASRSREEP